ncbi:MAG: Lrp/AsnC family transcriptional regulator [Actinomycetia bacterium]|nr:Lrp/AsnC family transcriptional regulator [Actinomycetes bacterium]
MADRMTDEVRPRADIDAIDLALLAEMQRDGRATYEALSRTLGLSRPATRARMLRLLDSGVVRIVGVAHPAVFGLTAYAHVAVTVQGPVLPVADRIAALEDSAFVSVVTGEQSLIAELRSENQTTLAATIGCVSALPGVRRVSTAVYTAILKDTYFPPGPYNPTSVDDVDRRLLECLQHDGRASFAELGELVGLSTSAARTRVLRLLESGTVHVGARVHPGALGLAQVVGFGLTFDGRAQQAIAALRQMPEVDYLATAIGRCDAIGTVISHSAEGVLQLLETVRATPGVRTVESWTHLRLVKVSYDRSSSPG